MHNRQQTRTYLKILPCHGAGGIRTPYLIVTLSGDRLVMGLGHQDPLGPGAKPIALVKPGFVGTRLRPIDPTFELQWTEIAKTLMEPLAIVEAFN